MRPLHGFLQDEKWYEDVLHVLMGILPLGLLLWAREWTTWRLPWPLRGQYPPGKPYYSGIKQPASLDTQLDRVSDIGRDELGYLIGATLRNLGLIGWLVWRFV